MTAILMTIAAVITAIATTCTVFYFSKQHTLNGPQFKQWP